MSSILIDCCFCEVFEGERDESIKAKWPCEQSICKYFPKGIPGKILVDAKKNCQYFKPIKWYTLEDLAAWQKKKYKKNMK